MKTSDIRQSFLDFFINKGHILFPSDSIVPQGDPTVLFTSAGMNQFKDYFLGIKKDVRRACSCQKCLRTDDILKVGKTPYHHTFFEMLGNFSFGDYFKEEAIIWAYEFVTQVLKIPYEKLWVSVYREDEESYNIWEKKVGFSASRIVRLLEDTNFWPANAPQLGPDGPCGPCSEIFFDKGKDYGCGRPECNPSCGCGRFVEIWNLVFTQYNRVGPNKLEPLPQKNIDTGMGLERVACVLQGKESNFQIDIFRPLVSFICEALSLEEKDKSELIYAISDHIRAAVFCVSEGIIPSNELRGYVVRKLLRRASSFSFLHNKTKPFLYKAAFVVSDIFKNVYPQLNETKENVAQIIRFEEEKFLSNLKNAQKLFEGMPQGTKELAGPTIFKLYDTYGLPLEVIRFFAQKRGLDLNEEEFHRLLKVAKDGSRKSSKFYKEVFSAPASSFSTQFLGYEELECRSRILSIRDKEGNDKESASIGEDVGLILDRTVFYGESGGQVGDKGRIKSSGQTPFLLEVVDTKRQSQTIIHWGKVLQGTIYTGEEVLCQVDKARRESIKRAHTATHLVQYALRKILGTHIKQAGSLVEEDRFRFDFTHFKALTPQEIGMVEEEVNSKILEDVKVEIEVMPLREAKKTGALAFFEEKYEERVRVVRIGSYSKELCGGTHIESTGKIGLFKIIKEQALQSGVRRIEALTGKRALQYLDSLRGKLEELSLLLKVPPEDILERVKALLSEVKFLQKNVREMDLAIFSKNLDKFLNQSFLLKGVKVILKSFEGKHLGQLRGYIDIISSQSPDDFMVIFISSKQERKDILIYRGKNFKGAFSAKDVLSWLEPLGIRGGGKENLVQGGTANNISEKDILNVLKNKVNYVE